MKLKRIRLACFFTALFALVTTARAQGTAFTYQGRLTENGTAANSTNDFTFTLYSAASGGATVGMSNVVNDLVLTNGLFTVALDFGADAFDGGVRWLQIAVRPGASGGAYTNLNPRQPINATPYAMRANSAGSAATVSGLQVNTNLSSTAFGFNTLADGSASTAMGQGSRASGTMSTAMGNNTVAAGLAATALGRSTLAGGAASLASGRDSVANGDYSTALGRSTTASGLDATALGNQTIASGAQATASGQSTTAGGIASFAAGTQARANHDGSFVWADYNYVDFASTASNQFLVRASGGVGINTNNPGGAALAVAGTVSANAVTTPRVGSPGNVPLELYVNNQRGLRIESDANDVPNVIGGSPVNFVAAGVVGATIAGGGSINYFSSAHTNRVVGNFGSVLGGLGNTAGALSTAMGFGTTANGDYSTAMGQRTTASGLSSTAMGNLTTASGTASTAMGNSTTASATTSTAMGYRARANHDGSFVWADSLYSDFASTASDQFLIRASGGVGIGTNNPNGAALAVNGDVTVKGNQTLTGNAGIGTPNPQGSLHVYSANNPTVVRVQSTGTPGFGRVEFVSNPQGDANEWRPGYIQSTDNGGFTGGLSFVVNGTGAANKFAEVETMRIENGRVGIGTATPVSALQVIGTVTATAFNPPSDRNLKENFALVSPREVLEKVAALPISRWNFKGDEATPHVGPMAQDFHAAFGLGTDDKHIATVDADGVALAAIQGLNQKLEETRAENAALKERLEKLERLLDAR